MNIYKKVQIFCYAVFLSLIINGNLYSSDIVLGLRCELNAAKEWNEDEKQNLQQTIGLKGARYTFLVPEKVKYHKNSKSRNIDAIKQLCRYENKILSVGIGEYDNPAAGGVYFNPHFTYNRDEYKNINVKAREYRMYVHGDTSLKPVLVVTSFFGIYPRFRYNLSAITGSNQPYYFVLIIKKRNKQDEVEVYSMKIMP